MRFFLREAPCLSVPCTILDVCVDSPLWIGALLVGDPDTCMTLCMTQNAYSLVFAKDPSWIHSLPGIPIEGMPSLQCCPPPWLPNRTNHFDYWHLPSLASPDSCCFLAIKLKSTSGVYLNNYIRKGTWKHASQ